MDEKKWLVQQFEANRERLKGVAYRLLGSVSEAEDAVQEAWLRLGASDAGGIGNLGGWLTTVVARICLDMLRSRKARREEPLTDETAEPAVETGLPLDPEREAILADAVGLALLVVLQNLEPAERIAFVLHDMFDLPFNEIAPIVERSEEATRQLASRARRRVRGTATIPDGELARNRSVVEAFLAASRSGDLRGLLALLDPDVVVRAGGAREIRGSAEAARFFLGKAQAARVALVDGRVGVVVAPGGRLLVVLNLTVANGRIAEIDAVTDVERLGRLELAAFDA